MRRHARPTRPVGSQTRSSPGQPGACRSAWHTHGIEKASAASTPQVGDSLWKAQPAARYRADGSTMEGTSGAAERTSLRGEVCKAALTSARARQRTAEGSSSCKRQAVRHARKGSITTAPTTSTSPSDERHERATGGAREQVGLGQSSHRERSRCEEPERKPSASDIRPLAQRLSAGRRAKAGRPSAARRVAERWRLPRTKLHRQATAGVVLRSSNGRGGARGSHRLQKSTDGVWSLAPEREERSEHVEGSSLLPRERSR